MMDQLLVKLNGDVLVQPFLDVRVEAAMSATATCDITIAASRTSAEVGASMLPANAEIGAAIEIIGGDPVNSMVRVFKGVVISVSWDIDAAAGEFVVIRAMDKSFKLWHNSPRRALVNLTYSDVISTIAREVGLSADVTGSAFNVVHEYQLQTTSSGELLHTIMGRTGGFWTVDDTKLIVREGNAAPSAEVAVDYGADILRLKARVSGVGGEAKVAVRSWDPAGNQVISATDSTKDVLLSAGLDRHLDKADRLADAAGVVSSHHIAADSKSAGHVAASLRRRAKASQLQVRIERQGAGDLDKIRPGAAIVLGAASRDLNGKYRVASVVHTYNSLGWRTIVNTGTLEPPTLPELTSEAARMTGWARQGPVVGIVSNNKPEDAAQNGMVKVKFMTVDDQVESAWARVVSVAGGKQRGIFAIPEVDDEVVVVFEQGDSSRPLVLGGLWSGKNPVPFLPDQYLESGKVKVWSITSRTGQRITITDGGGDADQHVEIAMPGDKIKLHVGTDKVELWADDKTLEVKSGDASMLLDDQGAMTLKAQKITLKATQDVVIEGANVSIKASANFKAEGNAGAEIKAGANGKFESSGPLELKGSIVSIN